MEKLKMYVKVKEEGDVVFTKYLRKVPNEISRKIIRELRKEYPGKEIILSSKIKGNFTLLGVEIDLGD